MSDLKKIDNMTDQHIDYSDAPALDDSFFTRKIIQLPKKKNTSKKETAIPLAYFITFTCYGTWLHGGKISSVDRAHNIPETPYLPLHAPREKSEQTRMNETPYYLDDQRRQIVLTTIEQVCQYRTWALLAAHVRTNHIHIVMCAPTNPEKIMSTLKAYISRRLNEAGLDQGRQQRWTRHGSTRYLWKAEEVEATIQYVVYEQGEPMSVFENKARDVGSCIM